MQNFLVLLIIPFSYFNFKILLSDIKYQKIPNKWLLCLIATLPFYYIGLFVIHDISILSFLPQVILSLAIWFILYNYGIWAAWDAKYLTVLWLFIPHIGIIPFIGNIGLITLVYLFGYFLYFYVGKCVFLRWYLKDLCSQVKNDISDRYQVFISPSKNSNIGSRFSYILIKIVFPFLVFFTIIRLIRIYLLSSLYSYQETIWWIWSLVQEYHFYLIFWVIWFIIGLQYVCKKIFIILLWYLNTYLPNNKSQYVGMITLCIIATFLAWFIVYEFIHATETIIPALKIIFTLYLAVALLFIILKYAYKVTFQVWEEQYVSYKHLKEWMVIDRISLANTLANNHSLWWSGNKKGMLYPSPKKAILDINRIITKDDIIFIKNIVHTVNKNLRKERDQPLISIKILKSFPFGPYILAGFMLTYIFQNKILQYFLSWILKIVEWI